MHGMTVSGTQELEQGTAARVVECSSTGGGGHYIMTDSEEFTALGSANDADFGLPLQILPKILEAFQMSVHIKDGPLRVTVP